jgi:hypothetical protein
MTTDNTTTPADTPEERLKRVIAEITSPDQITPALLNEMIRYMQDLHRVSTRSTRRLATVERTLNDQGSTKGSSAAVIGSPETTQIIGVAFELYSDEDIVSCFEGLPVNFKSLCKALRKDPGLKAAGLVENIERIKDVAAMMFISDAAEKDPPNAHVNAEAILADIGHDMGKTTGNDIDPRIADAINAGKGK